MLAKAEEIEERLQGAADPLKRAIQYAMTGNYIDFGAMQKVEEEQLERLLEKSQEIVVDPKEYEALRRELLAGRNVVYLTDNCGEIVLDKLLMKEILRQNPQARITAIVRGAPALNDATVEDAQQVGLSQVARVIGNGSAIAAGCIHRDLWTDGVHPQRFRAGRDGGRGDCRRRGGRLLPGRPHLPF